MQDAMEAAQKNSRKRKQPASSTHRNNPFNGMLTRNKSQKYFFHHTRSGKSRKSRLFPHPSLIKSTLPTRNPQKNNVNVGVNVDDDDEVYHISIKDLRARRVFSKPPQPNAGSGKIENISVDSKLIISKLAESDGVGISGENPSFSIDEKCDSRVDVKVEGLDGGNFSLFVSSEICDSVNSGGNPNLLKSEKCDSVVDGVSPNLLGLRKCDNLRVDSEAEGFGNPKSSEKCDLRVDCGGQVLDDVSPNLSKKYSKDRNGEDCEGMDEENVQTTPPDSVVLVSRNDDQNVLQNRYSVPTSPMKQINSFKDGCVEGKKTNSKKNLALKPCSRKKIYKAPNSFSYRRLLPYLMDIAKDEPCALKVNPSVKTEVIVDDNPIVSSSHGRVIDGSILDGRPLNNATACVPKEVSVHRKEEVSLEPKASDPSTQEVAVPQSSDPSTQQAAVSKGSDPSTQASVPKADDARTPGAAVQNPVDYSVDKSDYILACSASQIRSPVSHDSTKGVSYDDQVPSDNLVDMVHIPKASPEASTTRSIIEAPCLSLCAEGESTAAHAVEFKTEDKSICVFHSSSNLEAVVSPCAPVVGLAKGILKRNPRGCRGICNCLNCASFRLNADKAFEFSRNQLLDAEELTLDLMKELSNLRCMLEKSITGATDVAIVPVNQLQEACRRVSNVEDMARSRISQMNEDLYVHCRSKPLQRPRVNFSSNVQEKAMGELAKQNDQNVLSTIVRL